MTSSDVSSGNWLTPPHHRLGLHRVEDVVPCTTIARGEAPVRMLVPASEPLDWDLLTVPGPDGRPISAEEFLARTHTDGILVLRGDTILGERYFGGFTSASRHIVMSISKSFSRHAGRGAGRHRPPRPRGDRPDVRPGAGGGFLQPAPPWGSCST